MGTEVVLAEAYVRGFRGFNLKGFYAADPRRAYANHAKLVLEGK